MVKCRQIGRLVLFIILFLFICEYAIYTIVLFQCSWPSVPDGGDEGGVVKGMILADTHLLGPFRGHWFDKLRREWQMHRAFQTAIGQFQPEVVFFLGDLFDEGEWVDGKDFKKYVSRFEELFYVPQNTEIYVVAGNHDIGFHYQTGRKKNLRFQKAFNSSSVQLLRLKGSNFVLINSMAMENDGCFLCEEGLKELNSVQAQLECQQNPEKCKGNLVHTEYSSPIIFQHFPMYRESEGMCTGEDSAPQDEKDVKFRINMDCLSPESTELVLNTLKPRLIMSGHTHHHCSRNHEISGEKIREISVPSFSWRNRNDPSFYLAYFTKDNHYLSKCYMPKETTVKTIYGAGVLVIFFGIAARLIRLILRRSLR